MKFAIITQLNPKLMQAYYVSGFTVTNFFKLYSIIGDNMYERNFSKKTIFAQLLPKIMIANIS